MKKLLSITLIAMLTLTLVACSSGKIKDGTYTAEYKNLSFEWKDTLAVTYKDGVVVSAEYDAVNADGAKKSSMTNEQYSMTDPVLSEWLPILNENVVKANGDAEKIEAIAGATNSSTAAKALMVEVAKKAKAGDTTPAIIDNK